MTTVNYLLVYDDLIELLAKSAKLDEILSFQLSNEKQQRLDQLLAKSREGTLAPEQSAELDSFEQFEHVVRFLKARLREKQQLT